MKYHIAFKFIAVLLCACCLLVSVGAGLGIIALVECDLYNRTVEQLRMENQEYRMRYIAEDIAFSYIMENLSDLPTEAKTHYWANYNYVDWTDGEEVYYHLRDLDGKQQDSNIDPIAINGVQTLSIDIYSLMYPMVLGYQLLNPYTGQDISGTVPEMTVDPMTTEPTTTEATVDPMEMWIEDTVMPGNEEYAYFENWGYEDKEGFHQYRLGMRSGPKYTVTLYLTENIYEFEDHWSWDLAELGYAHRYHIIWVLGVSVLLFAALLVYLCCAAGRKPKSEEVCPGGLNRLPLDLYAVLAGGAGFGIVAVGWEILENSFNWDNPQWLLIPAAAAMALVVCLLAVGFLFACAAQFKMKDFYWAKHSVTGFCVRVGWKLLKKCFGWFCHGMRWIFGKLPTVFNVGKTIVIALWTGFAAAVKWLWRLLCRIIRKLWHGLQRLGQLLPLTWQWLLVGFVMVFVLLLSLSSRNTAAQFFGLVICICMVMYGAHCFGILLESTKRMSQGDLDSKVEDKLLLGSFQEYAKYLNALAGVAVDAANKQMKSERMKAELVTNVSHDIKTPLTSIINYVDLMEKAQSQEEAEAYLEVLSRQSQRLKKLIEDLMELSKASTGNMHVERMSVDVKETINQALGEFSEKLEGAQLIPVFQMQTDPMKMTADGRLTWRVLSNLLSNAVKYAMPGTRLYIDAVAVEGKVLISLKNISAQQLNICADELLERFVRGDASRNTEGSGLGLNIAKSLMQLQGGDLQLLVDGDLFKVTLVFDSEE